MTITLLHSACKSVSRTTWTFLTIGVFFCGFLTLFSQTQALSSHQRLIPLLDSPQPLSFQASDPLLCDVAFWLNAQKGENSFTTFQTLADFILHHPHWPRLSFLQRAAEEKLHKTAVPPQRLIAFFKVHPPLTSQGQICYIRALLSTNQQGIAYTHLRTYWHTTSLSLSDQDLFLKNFARFLKREDHEKRLMTLLWQHEVASVQSLLPLVSSQARATAQTVLRLIDKNPSIALKGATFLTRQKQPEIFLWAALKSLRHQKAYAELREAFLKMPSQLSHPKAFHRLRILAAREWLEVHKPQYAYDVLKNHSLPPGSEQADAEWHLGWIALSFLKQPQKALSHFQNFEKNVRTPISLARAGYWLGRTYQALNQTTRAQKAFQQAAHHRTTFYGQLACYELKRCPFPLLLSHPKVTSQQRQAFEKHDLVRVIRLLAPLGPRAHTPIVHLLCALAAHVSTTPERQLVVELASQTHPYLAVDLSRTLALKDPFMPLLKAAYPMPKTPSGLNAHEQIFTWAICYRESRFNPTIRGDAGEIGLMQLMPQTAVEVAANLNLVHSPRKLLNPLYNMQLGSGLLRDLSAQFNQNCCLVAAGYNGGCGAVNRWIQNVGDPQKTVFGVSGKTLECLINWVEAIPYEGTRDYVHRAIEAYIVYAGRIGQKANQVWKTLFGPC